MIEPQTPKARTPITSGEAERAPGDGVADRTSSSDVPTTDELRRIRASEAKYRTIFDSIDAGFVTHEVLYDDAGRPVDLRYLEMNPAYERHTGVPGIVGRTAREILPDFEDAWIETFARVARTGEPVRSEQYNADTGRWFNAYLSRVGGDGSAVVAAVFTDVSERKRAEAVLTAASARDAFLVRLTDALRPLTDPVEIQGEAARLIGERLGADRVLYADTEGDTIVVHRDWVRGIASMAGRYPASEWGEYVAVYLRGEPYVVHDVSCDPKVDETAIASYRAVDVAAFIGMGLVKGGAHVASFGVHSRTPRAWTTEEIALVRETADRTWAAVERARVELALRESEAKYRTIFDAIDEGFGTHEVLRDDTGRAVDIRYLETNPAYERHTGVSGIVGRTAREVLPEVGEVWIETFARVAHTGEPLRFEQYDVGTRRWYDVHLSRVGGDGSPVVAAVFTNVTARKRAEAVLAAAAERDAFLVRLTDALRPLGDPVAIQAEAMRVLGEHFGAVRALLWEMEPDGQHLASQGGYVRGMAPIAGRIRPEDFGIEVCAAFRAGRTLAVADTAAHPLVGEAELAAYRAVGIGSYVGVPLVKDGQWVAVLGLHRAEAHDWTPDEVALVEDVAERTWAAVERARSEAALRESAARLQQAVAATGLGVFDWDIASDRVTVNAEFVAMFGLSSGVDVRASSMMRDSVHPDDLAAVEACIAAAFDPRSSGLYEADYRATTPAGVRWVRVSGQVEFAGEGDDRRPARLLGVVQDIAVRRRAEEATEQARAAATRDALRRRLLAAEEAERQRLARELHDEAGQHLTGLALGLKALGDLAPPGSEVDQRVAALRGIAATLARELHSVAVRLRPRALDDFGLEAALAAYVEEWARQHGIAADVHTGMAGERLPAEVETALYRVVQEALTNVARHSGATRASVVVERHHGHVHGIVEDDGHGFDATATTTDFHRQLHAGVRGGLGLVGIRERAALLGGTVLVESGPGEGTTVFVRLPVHPGDADGDGSAPPATWTSGASA